MKSASSKTTGKVDPEVQAPSSVASVGRIGFFNDAGTVTVRNPWSPNSPPVDGDPNKGTVKISLDEFMKNFSGLTIAG